MSSKQSGSSLIRWLSSGSIFFQSGFKNWAVPLFLFVLCLISFGLLIPFLGFFWDDWPLILTGKFQGLSGFWPYWQYDRPFAAITYAFSYFLLGSHPLSWQIFSLLVRWATAVAMWWCLMRIWPQKKLVNSMAALLFAVFPVFTQQAISVAYNQHWICYFLYFLSLGLMIEAFWRPRWKWVLTVLAFAVSMFEMITMEYYVGLELLRPVFLWLLVARTPGNLKNRLSQLGRWWLPYLLGLLAFVSWRTFFIELPVEDRNAPELLIDLFSHPIQASLQLAQMALQDVSHIVITTWYATFQPGLFDLNTRFKMITLGLVGFTVFLTALFLHAQLKMDHIDQGEGAPSQSKAEILLGLALVFFGPLPAWATNRQVIIGAYSDRLAIPAMFGAALLIAGVISWLIRGQRQQILFVSLLVGLAAGYHFQTANDYRWARIQQNRFYWQLAWRAPAVTPNTAFFAEAEILPRTGLYSTAAGINILYGQPEPSGQLPYWFYSLTREFSHQIPEMVSGLPLETTFRQFSFQGTTLDGFIVYFQPDEADCMRVLTQLDGNDPALSAVVRQSLPISNLSRIQAAPARASLPAVDIFGPEPGHGWCYFFQKADLARQVGDWEAVASLGDQARSQGYSMENSQSNTPQEWIPFIEGYARTGRWQDSQAITHSALAGDPKMSIRLCDAWNTILKDIPAAENQQEAQEILSGLGCGLRIEPQP